MCESVQSEGKTPEGPGWVFLAAVLTGKVRIETGPLFAAFPHIL